MGEKLLVCALDALDQFNIYLLGLEYIQARWEEDGKIFTCTTLPHTAISNPMIFGGISNESNFWVEREDGIDGENGGQYVDPSQYFDRDSGAPVEGARGFSREQDYSNESFIWDDLYADGIDARAVQVPIVLPPYSFRTTRELKNSWFPDMPERMEQHVREKPKILQEQFENGAEVVFSSIQMPDKYLHAIGEEKASEKWVMQEAPQFDKEVAKLIQFCETRGIEWLLFGDHGSPHPGAMKKNGYILPRHRKESIIISSAGVNPPTYTDELYPWLLNRFDVEPVGSEWEQINSEKQSSTDPAKERLKNLGYL